MTEKCKASYKRKMLTLEDRVKVIQRKDKCETALAIDCGKKQIQNIIRDREVYNVIVAEWKRSFRPKDCKEA